MATRSPEAHGLLHRQRTVVHLVRAGGPQLSEDARRQLDATLSLTSDRKGGRARWSLPSVRPATAPLAFLLAAAIVAVSVWLATTSDGPAAPSLARVAMLAYRHPTSAPPRPSRAPSLLREQFDGVAFPNYQRRFGAQALGQRTDLTAGRTVQTVDYRLRDGVRISYSVVSGAPLSTPVSAYQATVAGIRVRTYVVHGLSVVTLVRHGRTCVLAGKVATGTIMALAAAPLLGADRV